MSDIPSWTAWLVSALLLLGSGVTFIGSLGLLRLGSFYERVHAPTLGTTLGVTFVALASLVFFSALENRPSIHEVVILALVIVTTPAGLILLVRAALFRDRVERHVDSQADRSAQSAMKPKRDG